MSPREHSNNCEGANTGHARILAARNNRDDETTALQRERTLTAA